MLAPLVSIIIPTYNREKIIHETLDCALLQDYQNIEIIIVDNCSTDRTFDILKEYQAKHSKIKIYQNAENLGPVRNWEVAISYVTGKYIKILWSDDKISPDFISRCVGILESNNDVGFVYTKTEIFFHDHEEIVYRFGDSGKYSSKDFIRNQFTEIKSVPVSPGCAFFRSDDVKESLIISIDNPKKLDFSRYGAGNDLLIFLLIANKYDSFYFIDDVCAFFRAHNESFSIANDLSEYYTYSKHYFAQNYLNYESYKNELDSFYYKLSKNDKLSYIISSVVFDLRNAKVQYFKNLFGKVLNRIKRRLSFENAYK